MRKKLNIGTELAGLIISRPTVHGNTCITYLHTFDVHLILYIWQSTLRMWSCLPKWYLHNISSTSFGYFCSTAATSTSLSPWGDAHFFLHGVQLKESSSFVNLLTLRPSWFIFSNQVRISGKRHCCWVFQMCFFFTPVYLKEGHYHQYTLEGSVSLQVRGNIWIDFGTVPLNFRPCSIFHAQ